LTPEKATFGHQKATKKMGRDIQVMAAFIFLRAPIHLEF
jgi:hypothetical protein